MAQPTRSASPAFDLARPPDAAIWPKEAGATVDDTDRETAVETAERLLGIDPRSDELAWVRDQASYYFASRDPYDTEFHPTGHDRAGQTRYRWEPRENQEKVGWLEN